MFEHFRQKRSIQGPLCPSIFEIADGKSAAVGLNRGLGRVQCAQQLTGQIDSTGGC